MSDAENNLLYHIKNWRELGQGGTPDLRPYPGEQVVYAWVTQKLAPFAQLPEDERVALVIAVFGEVQIIISRIERGREKIREELFDYHQPLAFEQIRTLRSAHGVSSIARTAFVQIERELEEYLNHTAWRDISVFLTGR